MAQALVEQHGGEVPATWRRSSTLPGVGRKTANVVLGHALGVPGLPVDRHVLRVANRIGIAESDDPEVVEQQLCGALPPERWTRTSDTLILHGRRICRPKPLCDQCVVRDDCDYFRLVIAHERGAGKAPNEADRRAENRWTENSSNASSLRRSRRSRAASGRRCRTSRSSSRTSRRPSCSTRWRSSRPTRCSACTRARRSPSARWGYGNALPDRILIFQGPHEREAEDEDDLVVAIGETLIHEIGHYFGMSEEEIEDDRGEATGGATTTSTT